MCTICYPTRRWSHRCDTMWFYTDATFNGERLWICFKPDTRHCPRFSLFPHGMNGKIQRLWAIRSGDISVSKRSVHVSMLTSNHRVILFQTVQSNSSNPSESLLAPPSLSLADINWTSARGDTVAANAITSVEIFKILKKQYITSLKLHNSNETLKEGCAL